MSQSAVEIPVEYTTPEGARTFANYLRTTLNNRNGIMYDKRVEFFKGKRLVDCILQQRGKWPKTLPKVTSPEVALAIGAAMLEQETSYFVRADKVDSDRGILMPSRVNNFEGSGYYVWVFTGSLMFSHVAVVLLIVAIIACTLMPLWPLAAKKMLWYASVTFLLVFTGVCIVRYFVAVVAWMFGIEFWIFPNMFDETLSIVDSFQPLYIFETGTPGQMIYRMAAMGLFVAFGYWAYTQPTDFEDLMAAQKGFVDDLYAGKLLPDASQYREAMGGNSRHNIYANNMPKLNEILDDIGDVEEDEDSPSGDGETVQNAKDEVSGFGDNAGEDQDEQDAEDMIEELLNNEEEDQE